MGKTCRMHGTIQKFIQNLVGKPEGKRQRPRHSSEDNIKMNLREVGCVAGDWIDHAQDRDQRRAYVRAAMNLRVP